MFMFAIFHFHHFSTGECLLRQCDSTVPSLHILVTVLEDKEDVEEMKRVGYVYFESSEKKLRRRLQCPPQEWPLLGRRVESMEQKIMSSNTSDITDEAVK